MSTLEIPETFPYAHQLGLRVIAEESNGFLFELPRDPRFIGNPVIPAFHGGIICGGMSSAMMFTVANMNGLEKHPELVNQTTSFLGSATAVKSIFFQAELTKPGRRILGAYCRAFQDSENQLVAKSSALFKLGPTEDG